MNIGGYDQAYGNTSGVFKNVGGRRPTLESIDWKGSFTDDQLLAIKYMTERRPMAPSGSTMTVTMKHFSTEIGEVFPLYLLKNIALKENISDEYEMSVGDTFSIKQLAVDGLNKNNVPYYGFDPDDGHWVFCDKSGNVEDHSDYVRYKDTSTDSGRSKLVATQKGVQYLKWILNNDVVNDKKYTALNEPGYTDNDSLNSVMVKLTIKEEPFAGKVMLDGTYTGYVDEAPVLLPDNGLEVTLEDTTGKEVSRQVTWMAKERKGIKVTEDGEVSFTEPGTYNVRVYVGEDPQDLEKGSEWVEINALDKKQAASLEISDDNDPKLLAEHVYSGTTESLDLSKLTVKGQDQYGNPWSYKPEDITWNVNGSDLQGTDFDVNGAGTYTICAKAGELTSNKLTLAVHELKKVEKKDATCTADGNKEYYECIDCHKLYSDDKAAKEMSKADVKVKALGHAWDKGTVKEAKASGTGTFTLTCTRDSKHKQVKKINNLLLSAKSSGDRITFKWSKEKLADGYEVYFAKCGGKDQLSSCKLVKTIKNNGTLTYKSAKVVNGKFYKGYVKAFKKISGKKVYLSTSHGVHLIAGNYTKKATNPKAVTVKAKTLSVNVGKTKKITGVKVTKMKGGRKLLTHDKKLRYGSSDSRIATVDGSGKITGVAKGNCTVYVIAINGVRTAVKVSVN